MKKEKSYIELSLKAFASGNITISQATEGLIKMCKDGKIFNWFSFRIGMFVGFILYIIGQLIIKLS